MAIAPQRTLFQYMKTEELGDLCLLHNINTRSDGVTTASRADTGVTNNISVIASFDKDERTSDTGQDSNDNKALKIIPKIVEKDEQAGTLTLTISVSDLPEGTAIEIPNGEIVNIGDNDAIEITVDEDDLDTDGMINIVALNEEGIVLANYYIQVASSNLSNPSTEIKTGNSFLSVLLWLLIGIVGVIVIALVVYLILRKRKGSE